MAAAFKDYLVKGGRKKHQVLASEGCAARRRNHIQPLRKLDGTWCVSPSEMELDEVLLPGGIH